MHVTQREGQITPFEEIQQYPDRFDYVEFTGEENVPMLRIIRKATGEVVQERWLNRFDEIEQHPERFDFVRVSGAEMTRIIRRKTGEIVAERHHFSQRVD